MYNRWKPRGRKGDTATGRLRISEEGFRAGFAAKENRRWLGVRWFVDGIVSARVTKV